MASKRKARRFAKKKAALDEAAKLWNQKSQAQKKAASRWFKRKGGSNK